MCRRNCIRPKFPHLGSGISEELLQYLLISLRDILEIYFTELHLLHSHFQVFGVGIPFAAFFHARYGVLDFVIGDLHSRVTSTTPNPLSLERPILMVKVFGRSIEA